MYNRMWPRWPATMSKQRCRMLQVEQFFRLCRNKLNMFNVFGPLSKKRNFTKNSFDIVAKNGNNVEATFDSVERIVRLVALDNVASPLLLV